MAKRIASLLAVALVCLCFSALAQTGAYSDYAGVYYYESGVGAWFVELTLNGDGSFQGHYQDQDYNAMDETFNGVSYEVILYNSDFTGRLSEPEYSDDMQLVCRVSALEYEENHRYVRGDTLYEPDESSGLELNDKVILYRAGSKRSALPEGLISWIWFRLEDDAEIVPFNTIYDETSDSGFALESPEEE